MEEKTTKEFTNKLLSLCRREQEIQKSFSEKRWNRDFNMYKADLLDLIFEYKEEFTLSNLAKELNLSDAEKEYWRQAMHNETFINFMSRGVKPNSYYVNSNINNTLHIFDQIIKSKINVFWFEHKSEIYEIDIYPGSQDLEKFKSFAQTEWRELKNTVNQLKKSEEEKRETLAAIKGCLTELVTAVNSHDRALFKSKITLFLENVGLIDPTKITSTFLAKFSKKKDEKNRQKLIDWDPGDGENIK